MCVWLGLCGLAMSRRPASGDTLTGEWRGSVFFHRISAQLEQTGTNIWGVVQVRGLFGGVDLYHFAGSQEGTCLHGAHHQGTTFAGELVSARRVNGMVTTRHGHKLRLALHKQPAPAAGPP